MSFLECRGIAEILQKAKTIALFPEILQRLEVLTMSAFLVAFVDKFVPAAFLIYNV